MWRNSVMIRRQEQRLNQARLPSKDVRKTGWPHDSTDRADIVLQHLVPRFNQPPLPGKESRRPEEDTIGLTVPTPDSGGDQCLDILGG